MKTFKQHLQESTDLKISMSIASAIYKTLSDKGSSVKDPDGSYQCHASNDFIRSRFDGQWWFKNLIFHDWNEYKWKEVSEQLIKDQAIKKFSNRSIKELIEDISDFTVNGHSFMEYKGYFIDPYLKSKKVADKSIQAFDKYFKKLI